MGARGWPFGLQAFMFHACCAKPSLRVRSSSSESNWTCLPTGKVISLSLLVHDLLMISLNLVMNNL